MSEYIAHKLQEEPEYKKQTIEEHLKNTAYLCRTYAKDMNCGELGYLIGLLHDIGKYSDDFQRKINNNPKIRVDHSTAGGVLAMKQYGLTGKLMSYCIMGHHGGIPNGGSKADTEDDVTLAGREKRRIKDYSNYEKELQLPSTVAFPKLNKIGKGGFTISSFIKILYSCLVDGDFLDTEQYMTKGQVVRGGYPEIAFLKKLFFEKISILPKDNSEINLKRNAILKNCIEKAKEKNNLFTLTVPTGGGKTLSSMAFSLTHAVYNQMKRVIYVIPYTSIIEQNAKVFKDILGEEVVLEHHSNFDFGDDENNIMNRQKLASENWEIPIVVTTNVQFFESFFSNKPSKCRKLHNMANSVIILDEAQMLPTDYLKPCLSMLEELVTNYHSTVVLCSATQPAITNYMQRKIPTQEICEDVKGLYQFFKRTRIVHRGKMTNEELVMELEKAGRALCIVNTKRQARHLFDGLTCKNAYHLSTAMCPIHRKEILKRIKEHLKREEPCVVISTQLMEAGVDVDFPVVYRGEAGLDSLIQSAGRCNREGREDVKEVYVFEPEVQYRTHMPDVLRLPIEITKSIFRNYEDVTSPEAIQKYFEELYDNRGESLDSQGIVKDFDEGSSSLDFPFRKVAEKFRLIPENTKAVIIPYETPEMEVTKLLDTLRYGGPHRRVLQSLQCYTVNVYESQFDKLFGAGKLDVIQETIFALRDRECYNMDKGLELDLENGIGLFY
ncbi:MAG: CRISPR-associated helicase Cas3' [Lachnospiraceae bacterium]